ncbi:glucokinase [uncultured Pseudoteredinibacter sp.]|uniref:glucokinase n=1 Tax=uncultured Pseudoteredinibacter sp. TaxID=1641701 RepID=UPI00260BB1D4|nr:glucokinase [uncultured Pseudoteredinibacter sp.]
MTEKVLIGDIGGTHARFALVQTGQTALSALVTYQCDHFDSLYSAIQYYLRAHGGQGVSRLCLAVPGPVNLDQIQLVNNHWSFSQEALESKLNLPLKCINDFDAQALYVKQIPDKELFWFDAVRPSEEQGSCPRLVIGAGTGLGVSAIMPGGELVPSEGGHIAFAPYDEHQIRILKVLQRRFKRVSIERILSGPGLENLYWANSILLNKERCKTAPEITEGAENGDEIARKSIDDFLDIFAGVCGDFVLSMGAWDGVYISGGIIPKIRPFLSPSRFRQRFICKGRFTSVCSEIPIALLTSNEPGLRGCALA